MKSMAEAGGLRRGQHKSIRYYTPEIIVGNALLVVSAETKDRMRSIRLLERGNLFGCEAQRESCDGVRKVVRFCGANNRRSDEGFAEHPGKRELGSRNAAFFGEFT